MNLNEENSTNTYIDVPTTTTPSNFWRSNKKCRTTNTGMNQNIISKDIPYMGKREYLDEHIDMSL